MIQITDHLQGEGTYQYDCDKPDCDYCKIILGKKRVVDSIVNPDTEFLEQNWDKLSLRELSKRLKCTKRTICYRASKMGLDNKTVIHDGEKELELIDDFGGWF